MNVCLNHAAQREAHWECFRNNYTTQVQQQFSFKVLHTCEKENLWSDMPMPFSLLFMVAEPFGALSNTV